MGAVIVNKRNKIVGLGFNQCKSHTKSNSFNRNIHCEASAIFNLKRSKCPSSEFSIYIHRSGHDGSLRMSYPCIRCQELLKEHGISKVYYTSERGYEYVILS